MNVEIANRLYEYRKQNNLSQDELAEKIGVSRQAVSKWERAEASPDTDNLILLAKLYNVSLDELINNNPAKNQERNEKEEKLEGDYVNISSKGIHVVEEDGSEVHVGWRGVHVKDTKEDKEVHVGWDGIKVREGDEYIYDNEVWDYYHQHSFIKDFPVAIIVLIVYLILGGYYNLWHPGWLVFFAIPIYHTFIAFFFRKSWRGKLHAIPVMLSAITYYLYVGFVDGVWHPTWLVLLIGPCYHSLIDYLLPKKNKAKSELSNQETRESEVPSSQNDR